MPRIRGKVSEALNEAREWIEASREEVKEREAALTEARGQLLMHETIYAILEKTLTRQPRKSSKSNSGMARAVNNSLKPTSKSTVKVRKKRGVITGDNHDDGDAVKRAICVACGNYKDFVDHFQPSPHYHLFQSNARNAPDITLSDDVTGESGEPQVAHEAAGG